MLTVKLTSNYIEHKQDGTKVDHKTGDVVSLDDHDASVAVNTGFGTYVDYPPEAEVVPESKSTKAAQDAKAAQAERDAKAAQNTKDAQAVHDARDAQHGHSAKPQPKR